MFSSLFAAALQAAEVGRLPDALVRVGIRKLLHQRATLLAGLSPDDAQEQVRSFIANCRTSRVAELPEKANEQHYEVPAELFQAALGPRLKYSCGHFESEGMDLAAAEVSALRITCERAALRDGQTVLELGCGWGSLSLWMAEQYPHSRIVGVSNSHGQRDFILRQAAARGLQNLEIITADVNDFESDRPFDRVVSIEMFEHMRNHPLLLRRIAGWLLPEGRLFVHIFCHRSIPYLFEDTGPQDWMTRYFFAGGMMPSDALFLRYQEDLRLVDQWRWSGQHYERTCNAWLRRTDLRREQLLPLLEATYGPGQGLLWLQRWRIFFMACAELFGYNRGNEWWVSHYLFERPA